MMLVLAICRFDSSYRRIPRRGCVQAIKIWFPLVPMPTDCAILRSQLEELRRQVNDLQNTINVGLDLSPSKDSHTQRYRSSFSANGDGLSQKSSKSLASSPNSTYTAPGSYFGLTVTSPSAEPICGPFKLDSVHLRLEIVHELFTL